ncbi:hypothetical protein Tco_0552864 [Tanacetum coccineum]
MKHKSINTGAKVIDMWSKTGWRWPSVLVNNPLIQTIPFIQIQDNTDDKAVWLCNGDNKHRFTTNKVWKDYIPEYQKVPRVKDLGELDRVPGIEFVQCPIHVTAMEDRLDLPKARMEEPLRGSVHFTLTKYARIICSRWRESGDGDGDGLAVEWHLPDSTILRLHRRHHGHMKMQEATRSGIVINCLVVILKQFKLDIAFCHIGLPYCLKLKAGLGSVVVPADELSFFVACVSDLWWGIVETIVSAMSSMMSCGSVPVKSPILDRSSSLLRL